MGVAERWMERGVSHPSALVSRYRSPGLHVATLTRHSLDELHLTLHPLPGESLHGTFQRFGAVVREAGARVVKQTILGTLAASTEGLQALREVLGPIQWPVTWVEGGPCASGSLAGIQAYAVRGARVETLQCQGQVVGCVFADAWARYCLLGDLRPKDDSAPRRVQALQVFEAMDHALAQAGMRLSHLVRTWFFMDHLLEWYHEFNPVRTRFYAEKDVFDGVVPASTGIEGRNPAGTALVAEAIALQPMNNDVFVIEADSPLQCSARSYGSAFSRAVEVRLPDARRLFISGTASISQEGRSLHVGNVAAQLEHTLEVVAAILHARGMSFDDICRAIAYFKHPSDAPLLHRCCQAHHIAPLPVLVTHGNVCREDLLFEIELDAVKADKVG